MYDSSITISIREADVCKFDYQKLNYGTIEAKEIKIIATGAPNLSSTTTII
jgi:hypothetical protein